MFQPDSLQLGLEGEGLDHVFRAHPGVELLVCEELELRDGGLAERKPVLVCILCDLGCVVVSDVGVERGDKHQRRGHVCIDLLAVDFKVLHTVQRKGRTGIA